MRGMLKTVTEFTVTGNTALNANNFRIELKSVEPLLPMEPGQFVNVEIEGNKDVFLRRPFSVFEVDYENCTLTLLVKILGKGSLTLSATRKGDKLSIIYPLGRGFTLPAPGEKVLAVGGGSGVAPVLFLSRRTKSTPDRFHLILGARSASDQVGTDGYETSASIHHTTEDGSMGVKGFVTNHPLFADLTQFDRIYACGPLPMMKAIAAKAAAAGVSCEVSLENLMACGFGVCLCCIEPTVKGNLCVCTEGPVFNINDLLW